MESLYYLIWTAEKSQGRKRLAQTTGDLEERRGLGIGKDWIMVEREIETVLVIILLL